MPRVVKFGALTVLAGVIVGFGIVGWLWLHHRPSTSQASVVEPSLSSGGSPLSVAAGGEDGLQGEPVSGSSSSSSGSSSDSSGGQSESGSSSSGSQSSSQLPSPSGFSVYNQYKNYSSGLFIDVAQGTGKAVASGSVVTMDFQLYLTNGQEIEETTGDKPYTFTEGSGGVITGVEEAMFGMKVGGQRRLIIPPSVGFGAAGKSPVPPNAVLIFDVSLLNIK